MTDAPELHLERVLEGPYDSAEATLRKGPKAWLPGFEAVGDRVTGELTYRQAGRRVSRRIEITVGPVQRFAYGVTVRLEWQAADHARLYPTLDGHLRLERGQPSGAVLRLAARYRPPGGRVGATADRTVLHRVAEASVTDFLERIAKNLCGSPEMKDLT